MPLLSKRAYARHREEVGLPGKSLAAVQKALTSGRIQANADGLIDSEAADRAWAANTSEGHRRGSPQDAPRPEPARPPPPQARPAPEPDAPVGPSFAQASAIEKAYKAKLAKLEYEERSGKLIPAADVEARWVMLVSQSKTKLLGIASWLHQQDPTLTAEQISMIDEAIRAALEDLAQ